jgi:hypothetical protein
MSRFLCGLGLLSFCLVGCGTAQPTAGDAPAAEYESEYDPSEGMASGEEKSSEGEAAADADSGSN